MLSRIVSNNNEDSNYPLTNGHTVYPDNLIVDCCIRADEPCTAYVESMAITDTYVTITMSLSKGDGDSISVYGHMVKAPGIPIIKLVRRSDDIDIGWVWLGSGINNTGTYIQKVPIYDSCLRFNSINDPVSLVVNGKNYPVSKTLNIIISGDLDTTYDSGAFMVHRSAYESVRYDSDDVNTKGGIVTINGVASEDRTLHISLPKYTDIESGGIYDVFTVYEEDSSDNVTVISIKQMSNNNKHIEPFTCPDSDILLDKIITGGTNISGSEAPLDSFIDWYKQRNSNN